ncbi:MAG: outer membrane protein assembly factor BamD [Bdellovibrionales bacterium]|nr:outer membrane protein assembly factor BamD [Bdellovibrionales bacterium]
MKISRILLLSVVGAGLLACSASKSKRHNNPVSEYDPAFEEAAEEIRDEPQLPDSDAEAELIEQAQADYDRELYSLAKESFQNLEQRYPASYYVPYAELKSADCEFQLQNYTAALAAYQGFLEVHPRHEAAPYAMLQIANSYRLQYKGESQDQTPLLTSIKHYRELITTYPASQYAVLARRHIDAARELLAEHELLVADFYRKQQQFDAAAHRYRLLLKNYADTHAATELRRSAPERFAESPELMAVVGRPGSSENEQGAAGVEGKKKELMPQAPALVADAASGATLTRFRIARESVPAPANEPDQNATFSTSPRLQGLPPFVLTLNCHQEDDVVIFDTHFTVRPRVAVVKELGGSDPTERHSLLHIRPAAAQGVEQVGFDPHSAPTACKVGSVRANIEMRENSIELNLRYPAGFSYRTLVLDRPHRVIAVIRPTQTQASS